MSCVDCGANTQSRRSPRCQPCRDENRRKANLARVRRYQSTARGRQAIARRDRKSSDHRYNTSVKGHRRSARFLAEHGRVRPSRAMPPLPMPYVGDPIFERARDAARVHDNYRSDFGQNDWMGEAVVAILEGRDPDTAVRAHRRREAVHDRLSVRMVDITSLGHDGRRLVFGSYEDEAA